MTRIHLLSYTMLFFFLLCNTVYSSSYGTGSEAADLAFGTVLVSLGTATSLVTALLLKRYCQKIGKREEAELLINNGNDHVYGAKEIVWTGACSVLFLMYGTYMIMHGTGH